MRTLADLVVDPPAWCLFSSANVLKKLHSKRRVYIGIIRHARCEEATGDGRRLLEIFADKRRSPVSRYPRVAGHLSVSSACISGSYSDTTPCCCVKVFLVIPNISSELRRFHTLALCSLTAANSIRCNVFYVRAMCGRQTVKRYNKTGNGLMSWTNDIRGVHIRLCIRPRIYLPVVVPMGITTA